MCDCLMREYFCIKGPPMPNSWWFRCWVSIVCSIFAHRAPVVHALDRRRKMAATEIILKKA